MALSAFRTSCSSRAPKSAPAASEVSGYETIWRADISDCSVWSDTLRSKLVVFTGEHLDAIGALAQRQLDNTDGCAGEVQTVQNDVPPNPCILRHHRTFALLPGKVQSNQRLPGAQFTARSSPRSRFEPAVRTTGRPVARHPQPRGRKSALRREIPSILRGFQGRLSC